MLFRIDSLDNLYSGTPESHRQEPPCEQAIWDESRQYWTLEVVSVEALQQLWKAKWLEDAEFRAQTGSEHEKQLMIAFLPSADGVIAGQIWIMDTAPEALYRTEKIHA